MVRKMASSSILFWGQILGGLNLCFFGSHKPGKLSGANFHAKVSLNSKLA